LVEQSNGASVVDGDQRHEILRWLLGARQNC
jgi:hypothetical protein